MNSLIYRSFIDTRVYNLFFLISEVRTFFKKDIPKASVPKSFHVSGFRKHHI